MEESAVLSPCPDLFPKPSYSYLPLAQQQTQKSDIQNDIKKDQDTKKNPLLGCQKGSGKCFSSKVFPPISLEGGKEDFSSVYGGDENSFA